LPAATFSTSIMMKQFIIILVLWFGAESCSKMTWRWKFINSQKTLSIFEKKYCYITLNAFIRLVLLYMYEESQQYLFAKNRKGIVLFAEK